MNTSRQDFIAAEYFPGLPTRIDIGVVGSYPPDSPIAFEIWAFFSDHNGAIIEDPVTGSLNASMAQWLVASGRALAPYTASKELVVAALVASLSTKIRQALCGLAAERAHAFLVYVQSK